MHGGGAAGVWTAACSVTWVGLVCALQVKAGLGVNVIGLVIVMVAINTWGVSLFHLDTFPAWAKVSNITDQA